MHILILTHAACVVGGGALGYLFGSSVQKKALAAMKQAADAAAKKLG